ncbi:MAG: FAD-dependent monooxygenase [Bacteroidia bacterium]|nr:FAD-dependent monooxygenase [Bacteroidia bacterium]
MKKDERLIIVGAGLAGSLLAATLARKGYAVDVYERRADMRRMDMSAGRSINLALSVRGINALRQVGMDDTILSLALPMRGRMMHALDGTTTFQRYGSQPHDVIHSVSRGELNKRLMDAAEAQENVRIHFSHRCTDMDLATGEATFVDDASGARITDSATALIATDGAGSAVREAMERQPGFAMTQDFLEHGYKELLIPPTNDGDFRLDPDALHIWPRHSYMMIALPNPDRTFTCTLFLQHEGDPSFAVLDTPGRVLAFFREQFPDALPLMPTLLDDFFANPTGALGTVRCAPWNSGGTALLLGDAAHAIVPFFGQGMNCAFEDVVELDRCIDACGGDWAATFALCAERRKPNADAIADMALENFIEMRDRVADPVFLFMKEAGLALEKRFPDYFIPKYSMVSFTLLPYAVAQRRGALQQQILETLTRGVSRIEDIDMDHAERLITSALRPWAEDATT